MHLKPSFLVHTQAVKQDNTSLMAISKPALAFLLLFVLVAVDAHIALDDPLVLMSKARSLLEAPKLDCPSTCTARCSRNWQNKMCNKLCNICCSKCNCVPPGTGQDTRHLCPCYDAMTNPKTGRPKCP